MGRNVAPEKPEAVRPRQLLDAIHFREEIEPIALAQGAPPDLDPPHRELGAQAAGGEGAALAGEGEEA